MTNRDNLISRAVGLWRDWDGANYVAQIPDSLVYYTLDHIDASQDLIWDSLARVMQREGVADGLGAAYRRLSRAIAVHGWMGDLEGGDGLTACDREGHTYYGDTVHNLQAVTWIEVPEDE